MSLPRRPEGWLSRAELAAELGCQPQALYDVLLRFRHQALLVDHETVRRGRGKHVYPPEVLVALRKRARKMAPKPKPASEPRPRAQRPAPAVGEALGSGKNKAARRPLPPKQAVRPEGWLTRAEMNAILDHPPTVIKTLLERMVRDGQLDQVIVSIGAGRLRALTSVYPPEALDLLRASPRLSLPRAGDDMVAVSVAAKQAGLSAEQLRTRLVAFGVEPQPMIGPDGLKRPYCPKAALQGALTRHVPQCPDVWITAGDAVQGLGVATSRLLHWCKKHGIETRVATNGRRTVPWDAAQRWRAETGRPLMEAFDPGDTWIQGAEAVRGTGGSVRDLVAWCRRRGIAVRKERQRMLVPVEAARLWSERLAPGVPVVAQRPRGWLGRAQAADRLGVSMNTVVHLAARGRLEAANVRGLWFFSPESIEMLAREAMKGPPPGAVRVETYDQGVWFRKRGIQPRQYRIPGCPRNQQGNYVSAAEWQLYETRERRHRSKRAQYTTAPDAARVEE